MGSDHDDVKYNCLSYIKFFKFNRIIWVLSLALILGSCDLFSDDEEDDDVLDDEDVVLQEETVIIEPEDADVVEIDENLITLQIDDTTPDIEENDVIVGEESGGFLRRVNAIEIEDDIATIETVNASLVDVIERGELSETIDATGAGTQDVKWDVEQKVEGVELESEPQDIDWSYSLDNVNLTEELDSNIDIKLDNGHVRFSPAINLDIDINAFDIGLGDPAIQEFRLSKKGDLDFETDVVVVAEDAINIDEELNLITFQTGPVVFYIGIVPVVVTFNMDFVAVFEAGVSHEASVTTGLETTNSVELGALYNQEWTRIAEWEEESDHRGFDWQVGELEIDGYISIRPELSIDFYQVLGPFINAGPFVESEATISPTFWMWQLWAGLDAEFGGSIEVLDYNLAEYSFGQTIWKDEIASEQGEDDPQEHELHINIVGEGEVDVDPDKQTYEDGEEVTLTAEPSQDWSFVEWDGDIQGTENPKTIELYSDQTVEAVFEHDPSHGELVENLVSYWEFNEGSGQVVHDVHSNNDAEFNGNPEWQSNGVVNNTLEFDGENDFLEVQDHDGEHNLFDIEDEYTKSVWIKLDNTDADSYYRAFHNQSSASSIGSRNGGTNISIREGGNISASAGKGVSGSENRSVTTEEEVNTGEWIHIVAVLEDELIEVYINGELSMQNNLPSGDIKFSEVQTYNHTNVWIGANPRNQSSGIPQPTPYDDTRNFKGKIDELGIWNRALSEQEVNVLYNQGSGLSHDEF